MNLKQLSKWDRKFFDLAILTGSWSKDTKHKIGCVIVDDDHNMLSGGYNGFPRKVVDDSRLWYKNREIKNQIIIHAEANAVAAAARNGHATKGGTAYSLLPPCTQCAGLLIQAGVKKIYFFSNTTDHWGENFNLSKVILNEAEVEFVEVNVKGKFGMKRFSLVG